MAEAIIMVMLYMDNQIKNQEFSGSDHSSGAVVVQHVDSHPVMDFSFYGHAHPSFWVPASQFKNGKQVTVKTIGDDEKLELALN